MILNWKDVWTIQNGKGRKVHVPSIDELNENAQFALTDIPISEIDLTFVSRLRDFRQYACIDDVIAVESLMDAYIKGEPIPPIVLTKQKEIIDGIHRLSAQLELNRVKIAAYIEI